MAEDLPFKLGEEGAGLETKLVTQDLPTAPVHLERVCVAAGAVERDHQLAAELFAQRVFGDALLELGHELGMVAELELRLDPLFGGGEAELLQAGDLELGPVLVLELLERPSAPQRQRPFQGEDRLVRVLLGSEPGQSLELLGVGVGRHQQVARSSRQDGVGAESASKLRHVPLERLVRAGRWPA